MCWEVKNKDPLFFDTIILSSFCTPDHTNVFTPTCQLMRLEESKGLSAIPSALYFDETLIFSEAFLIPMSVHLMHCGLDILTTFCFAHIGKLTSLIKTLQGPALVLTKETNPPKISKRHSSILSTLILQPGREDSSHLLQEVFRVDAHT